MLNKLVPSGKYIIYRKAIWLYLFLLIFEGALRKWIVPSLSTPLLLVRDPIVIWLVLVGFQKKWFNNGYAIAMMAVSTISFVATLIVGHQNIFVALYGWRTYFFYFPFIFLIGKVLTREDLLRMGRFVLYLLIPMTVLIVIQFYSPQSAWVNRGVGGDMTGAGFGGALGYFRPPGTFSFISGTTNFLLVAACFLFYFLLVNNKLEYKYQIKSWLLWIIFGCYLITIPYSISRTHFFQTCVVLAFTIIAGLFVKQYRTTGIRMTIIGIVLIGVIFTLNLATDSMAAFTARFETANEAEGGMVEGVLGNRYLGSMLRWIYLGIDAPFWGHGIGIGTNVGAKIFAQDDNIYSFFNGEEEFSRIIGECGLFLGFSIILIRILFALSTLRKSFRCLLRRYDILPWLLTVAVLLKIINGQYGNPTGLGFAIFMAGVALASISISVKKTLP